MPSSDFFLPPVFGGNDKFRGPQHLGQKVAGLVDGQDTFAAMELSAATAKSYVYFAAWAFGHSKDPKVSLINPEPVSKALAGRGITKRTPRSWVALFGVLAEHGIDVRIVLSDFDAIEAPANHLGAWRAHAVLLEEATRVEKVTKTRSLHVICSRHEATVTTLFPGHTIDDELRPKLTRIVSRIAALKTKADRRGELTRRPGIWPFIDINATTFVPSVKASPNWVMYPASHHQKLLVIDGQVAYCGGLDLATTRADTQKHDNQFRRWHDVQCRIEGEVAHDAARSFVGRWDQERLAFNTRVSQITTTYPTLGLRTQAPAATLPTPPAPTTPAGGSVEGQLLRTVASASLSLVRDDVLLSYENAISRASSFVYVENQYVRDSRIADWIIARTASNPQLVVIVVVPVAPEEASPTGIDPITEHGMYLQHEILKRLADNPRGQFGMFSLVAAAPAGKPRMTDAPKIAPAGFASRQIYVHSKVLIVDDVFAIVGSANANPRSFEVDTEACIAYYDLAAVRDLRLTLWRELLGNPSGLATWAPAAFLAQWNAIATANKIATKRSERKGFIIPHELERFPGDSHFYVPDKYTGLAEFDEPVLV